MGKFIGVESYKHKLAKELFASWLNQSDGNFAQFAWRKGYGVHVELKFYESSRPYYFEDGNNSGLISFVPDITVFSNGIPIYLFEIVHKSDLTHEKLFKIVCFFYPYTIEVFTISADYILNQISPPNHIKANKIL